MATSVTSSGHKCDKPRPQAWGPHACFGLQRQQPHERDSSAASCVCQWLSVTVALAPRSVHNPGYSLEDDRCNQAAHPNTEDRHRPCICPTTPRHMQCRQQVLHLPHNPQHTQALCVCAPKPQTHNGSVRARLPSPTACGHRCAILEPCPALLALLEPCMHSY